MEPPSWDIIAPPFTLITGSRLVRCAIKYDYSGQLHSILTAHPHNVIVVWMLPDFNRAGLLPPGIHRANWDELTQRFGHNSWRRRLLAGLRAALESLKDAGCRTAYIDGSFVTDKEYPNDFDACWEETSVDPYLLDPVLLTFDSGRATQKAKYFGELFPASVAADAEGLSFLEFFQTDRDTGEQKGLVVIDLEDLT